MAWGDHLGAGEGEDPAPRGKVHAVFLPFPAWSHIAQQIHLARQLVREFAFTATIITSSHYHKEFTKSEDTAGLNRGIEFAHVSDGLADDHPRVLGNIMEYLMAVFSMEPGINALLSELHDKAPVTCLVRDVHLPFQFKGMRDAGVAIASFLPNSAIKEQSNRQVRALIDGGFLPDVTANDKEQSIDWERLITGIEGVPPQLRVGDLPIWASVKERLHAAVVDSIENRTKKYVHSDWVVVNTVYELERETVDAMRKQTPNVCTCGPVGLVDYVAGEETDIEWLNQQEAGSVIVVAFGTTTFRSIEQFEEIAHGLEASQQKFLWVFGAEQVVSGSSESERESFLSFMAGFSERTKGRGHVTKWVSKFLATLRHPAVGAFLSHCGWHSVLEGVASGLPFLTWPFQYDHWPAARLVTHVWKTGLSLDTDAERGLVTSNEVACKVRRLLAKKGEDPELDAIRVRAEHLKSVTEKAVTRGGSSQLSLASFVAGVTKNGTSQ